MKVRTREIPPEQEFILKNKKFEHILSWSIMLVIIGLFAGFFGYFIYSNTQNLYSGFMIGSNIFSLVYIRAIHSRVDGKTISIQWGKLFQKYFSREFLIIIIWGGLLMANLYSAKGVYGIFIALNIILLLYVMGSVLFFLGKKLIKFLLFLGGLFIKLISGELQKYIASKITFIGGGINYIENAEVFESENMNQNMKYYNSKKLKNDFQSYLFWKNITNAFSIYSPFLYLPILIFLIAYISLILSIIISGKIIFIGLFFIAIIISMIIFGPYLSFFKNKKHIQIKTLSFSPKTYAWKDKNTLYFK